MAFVRSAFHYGSPILGCSSRLLRQPFLGSSVFLRRILTSRSLHRKDLFFFSSVAVPPVTFGFVVRQNKLAGASYCSSRSPDDSPSTPPAGPPRAGFHRRELPAPSVGFSTAEGIAIFNTAMEQGGLATYFMIAENFRTQDEPAYCGLGTLVTVLNALSIDPGKIWKGVWRWFDESMLECCKPLELVREEGITIEEWGCLARANGLKLDDGFRRAEESSEAAFRSAVHDACCKGKFLLIVSYSRKVLKQTGDGHYSPIGGYCKERDMVLIMDVARFKHPPHWVPLSVVWEAMLLPDPSTGKSRGFALCARDESVGGTVFVFNRNSRLWVHVKSYFETSQSMGDERHVVAYNLMFEAPPAVAAFVSTHECHLQEHHDDVHDGGAKAHSEHLSVVKEQLRSTPLFGALRKGHDLARPLPMTMENATMLLLCMSAVVKLSSPIEQLVEETLKYAEGHNELKKEIEALRAQILLASSADGAYGKMCKVGSRSCRVACA